MNYYHKKFQGFFLNSKEFYADLSCTPFYVADVFEDEDDAQ